MDNWGDPWADNANQTPPLLDVNTSATPRSSAALPIWNDAPGWANEGDDDNDWGAFEDPWNGKADELEVDGDFHAEDSGVGSASDQMQATSQTPQISPDTLRADRLEDELEDEASNSTASHISSSSPTSTFIASPPLSTIDILPETASEMGEHGQGLPQNNAVFQHPSRLIDGEEYAYQYTGEDSTRPSTSHTETSSIKESSGSPRTSVEDEHHDIRHLEKAEPSPGTEDVDQLAKIPKRGTHDDNDQFAIHQKQAAVTEDGTSSEDEISTTVGRRNSPAPIPSFVIDTSIVEDLLGETPESKSLGQPIDDMLTSTSSRKAWYRLTRQETMREFDTGKDNNNYVRVAWRDSQVRKNVNEVVIRWMVEDRATGKPSLGRPGAAFGWDQPQHPAQRTAPTRLQAPSSTITERSQSTEDLQSNSESKASESSFAQFGWSSTASREDNSDLKDNLTKELAQDSPKKAKVSFAVQALSKIRPMSTDLSIQMSHYKHTRGSQSVSGPKNQALRPAIDDLMHSVAQKDMKISPMVPAEKVPVSPDSLQWPLQDGTDPWRDATTMGKPSVETGISDEDEWRDMKPSGTTIEQGVDSFGSRAAFASERRASSEHTTTQLFAQTQHDRVPTEPSNPSLLLYPACQTANDDTWADADLTVLNPTPTRSLEATLQIHDSRPFDAAVPAVQTRPSSPTPSKSIPAAHTRTPSSASLALADEQESQNVIRSVLMDLPDFSYMMR
ncbi:hypothetical protein EJ05DRAFT_479278 [Pseudovirgaria hyperparasitica]|uniref:Uncharacterized protein n=1 Tax=Pseudovirgaria hyperparasitica TaxID=470096 RepID=A0A6A6VYD7_9PEZI|nr:uncharacterized protein EJ05DRAFT_479278 [Pseudovirgaria hyperparasitica]KAF2754869.1 hypothetical protein EJ05DRAFT_479278 [Pseudovirgaria hyperparasitica]